MKRLLLIFVATVVASCSFDNKTGIWKDASNTPVDNKNTKSIIGNTPNIIYENIFTKKESFNEEKEPDNFSSIKINKPIKIIFLCADPFF